jgi:acetyl esterase
MTPSEIDMPIDPQVQQWLTAASLAGLPPMNELPVSEARSNMLNGCCDFAPIVDVGSVVDLNATTPAGVLIPLRHYSPSSEAEGVIIYFHGGGWVIGSRDTHDVYCRDIAMSTGCHVVSVEYRLAPEEIFPTAAEDCWHATQWISQNLGQITATPGKLYVAGDSAGGNLAAVTCLLARDRGGPQIDGQVLIYPITDSDFERQSYLEYATDRHLTRDMMIWFWRTYAPDRATWKDWRAAPFQADDLTGLPPAFTMTAEYDPLRDEGEEYARRLVTSGVRSKLKRYDGMIHGFVRHTEWPAAREALADFSAAIESFSSSSPPCRTFFENRP